jgi:signal transduction histidine kinase
VGRLVVSRRGASEDLAPADTRLLEDLARQAAMVVYAARLTAELQRSRARMVTAREEERRRLRRDLHDGLGPALAGVALQMENAGILIGEDAAAARALVSKLSSEIQAVVADVRRLVYELRPPALDELGLVAALRQQAEQFATRPGLRDGKGLVVSVEAPARLDGLPAAVEVAAYRIATEAMANAARHAGACRCTVSITVGRDLSLEIVDDGKGIQSDARQGVGLMSMRERAEELGGTSSVEAVPAGGTRVQVHLPVDAR